MIPSNAGARCLDSNANDPGGGGGVLKKGPWTAAEDAILIEYVKKNGEGNWNAVMKNSGLARCGKSCRLRWANHLRPNLKKGSFTAEEERLIIELHAKLGNKWARMASMLPGRTDNEIKNYWNTRIKRRIRQGLPLYPDDVQQNQPTTPATVDTASASAVPVSTSFSFYKNSPLCPITSAHQSNSPYLSSPTNFYVPHRSPPLLSSPTRFKRYRRHTARFSLRLSPTHQSPSTPNPLLPTTFDSISNHNYRTQFGSDLMISPNLFFSPELPSSQLLSNNTGLLEDLLAESQTVKRHGLMASQEDIHHESLLRSVRSWDCSNFSSSRQNLLNSEEEKHHESSLRSVRSWDDSTFNLSSSKHEKPHDSLTKPGSIWDDSNSICPSRGNLKEEPAENMNTMTHEDFSKLLNFMPSTIQVPEWYENGTEISNQQSLNTAVNNLGIEMQQIASLLPVTSSAPNSCSWDNLPEIC